MALPQQPQLSPQRRVRAAGWVVIPLALGLVVVGLVRAFAPSEAVSAKQQATPSLASASSCADVLFVGADGDAEVPSSTRAFGPTLSVVHRRYAQSSTISPWSVETRRVTYVSQPIRTIKRSAGATGPVNRVVTRTSLNAWSAGASRGTTKTVRLLRAAAVACPQQQIILVGYAQGAGVIHRALLKLEPAIRARVTGAALVADPDRAPRTQARRLGSPPAASRPGGATTRLVRPSVDVPRERWTLPVWSVCSRGDVACDFGSTRIRRAIAVHRGYRTGGGATVLASVGSALWSRTTRHPMPKPGSLTAGTEVSQGFRLQLQVDAAPSARPSIRWSTRHRMPPGLLLSRTGLVSGTPTTAGTWRVTYHVRNISAPEYSRPVPGRLTVVVKPSGTGVISAGGGQACAVRQDGTAWCWGRNNWGQLGDGSTTTSSLPRQVGTARTWSTIETSGSTTCAVSQTGALYCWGLNHRGQVGDGTTTLRKRPVAVGGGQPWAVVSNSFFHTCGVRRDGTLWCWGWNAEGQLGDGTRTRRLRPKQVGTATDWTSVSAGGWSTCASKATGTLWCWGANSFGQLGDGTRGVRRLTPVQVGSATDWTGVNGDWSHTCGIKSAGTGFCWGRNTRGQLGDGTVRSRVNPVAVAGGQVWQRIDPGDSHTCGVTLAGATYCWGGSPYGALGTPGVTRSATPRLVTTGRAASADSGWLNSCAVEAGGRALCWGSNEYGQLGNGSYTDSGIPVEVK